MLAISRGEGFSLMLLLCPAAANWHLPPADSLLEPTLLPKQVSKVGHEISGDRAQQQLPPAATAAAHSSTAQPGLLLERAAAHGAGMYMHVQPEHLEHAAAHGAGNSPSKSPWDCTARVQQRRQPR